MGSTPPPFGSTPPPSGSTPPWFGAPDGPTFSREKLIRPTRGRYIAGVCGAIGRATNTDPVLWRVLLAVLGFFGGVGVLIYLAGWLLIPAEGDTASPIESLLGRGRSAMAPLSVVLLGAAAALTFAFIVRDGFRATLLAAAVLVVGALALKKSNRAGGPVTAGPAPADPWAATATFPAAAPAQPATAAPATAAPAPGEEPTTPFTETAAAEPAGEPVTAPLPPMPPMPGTASAPPAPPAPPTYTPPSFAPPTGGYRPPFAPHGPWAQGAAQPPYAPAAPPSPPKAPKPPRERSKLGRITFSLLVVVMGILALIDLAGADVPVSGYFAAALATIALGLVVGAWFGRARGLIFLAVLATFGLAVSSGVERFGGEFANSSYRPQSLAAVADRYDFSVGNATLDLRSVNFAGHDQAVTVAMKFGQVRVLLPANVDTTTSLTMNDGRALLYGRELTGNLNVQAVSDLGQDGEGGGTLRLTVEMNTGNVEVTR
ncbi:PspC domain-containing protein [Couchioplanes caeruleus]|uniref:PspC domain-containing protein n=1 Tax=Couchioplanes caeruleus TaxID=56438 RepID=UPI0020BFF135|nr:PspC domain-containing protein [Couchioplanes caeruleus]UQU64078.1 PspC domain-containing protein [Couchioplanes caeruleus]